MIAGRLHWRARGVKVSRPRGLAAFDFPNGSLLLTEAGTKKRASLHVVAGEAGLSALDPGGLEVLTADLDEFTRVLTASNHTLKRALTDPRSFSGIGNAYSDEILFEAQLSPVTLTQKLSSEEIKRLFQATRATLANWVERLRADGYRTGSGPRSRSGQPAWGRGCDQAQEKKDKTILAFPEKVTAFRPGMAVHGRYQQPCPRCHARVQRIRYASNET